MSIRVYGEEYIGLALSAASLAVLLKLAKERDGFAIVRGTVDGTKINEGLLGKEIPKFIRKIQQVA